MKGRVLTQDEYIAVSGLAERDKQVFFGMSRRQMFHRVCALGKLSRLRSLDGHTTANVQDLNATKSLLGFEVLLWAGFLVNPGYSDALTDYQRGLALIGVVDARSATILKLYHNQDLVDLNYEGNLSALGHLVRSFLGYNNRV